MFPGGNCLNVSIFLRRSGVESAYIGRIGKDPAGDLIWDALVAEGVDVSRLGRLDGPTAWCLIGHRDNDRIFLDHDLGVSMFTPSADDLAGLELFAAVHIGQSSGLDTFVPAAVHRTLLSYDFSTRRDPEHRHRIAPHCFLASLSGGNLSDAEVDTIADEVLESRSQLGSGDARRGGCCPQEWVRSVLHVGAAAAIVVDTFGAGDTFIARTFLGLLQVRGSRADISLQLLRKRRPIPAATSARSGSPSAIDIGPQAPGAAWKLRRPALKLSQTRRSIESPLQTNCTTS